MGDGRKVNPLSSMIGLLRLRIKRGINLVIRDFNSSDPYLLIRHGKQKLKTRVIKKNLNPVWNEDLTLCVMNLNDPVKLLVYDSDTFSSDDKMGDAEIDVKPFLEASKMKLESYPEGSVIKKVVSSQENCMGKDSCIVWSKGKLTQDLTLRLRNVEHGEIELGLTWIDVPSSFDA